MKLKTIASVLALSLAFIIAGCSKPREEAGHHAGENYAQRINCANNLKMIGIAFRVWASDHGKKFPFQISTNSGGALELVSPDKDGFDRNAFSYLKTMTEEGELTTPLLLVCPQDKSKKAAASWADLRPENITYQFCADTNVGPFSSRILAVCPVDGNVLYCDGTVVTNGGKYEKTAKSFTFELMEKELTNQGSR